MFEGMVDRALSRTQHQPPTPPAPVEEAPATKAQAAAATGSFSDIMRAVSKT
jgi:hypothetical protein